MLYRDFLAMETEELIRSHPVDGAVLMGGCDKTTPGLLLGATSAGVPGYFHAGRTYWILAQRFSARWKVEMLRWHDGDYRWFLFLTSRCATNRATSSNGMARIPISRTVSAPRHY